MTDGREPNGRFARGNRYSEAHWWKPGFRPEGACAPNKYDPAYCETVVEMGLRGKSKVQMAAAIGVSDQTLTNWREKHAEFAEAMHLAETCSQAWWEERGQDGLEDKNFNHAVWGRTMGARFRRDWSEQYRHEVTGKDGAALVVKLVRFTDDGNSSSE